MSVFEIKSDLPIETQKKIDALEAIPAANRTATQQAFLTALLPYLTNVIISVDADGLIMSASGLTVPTGYSGFSKGATFIKTDATGNGLYMNTADTTSAAWDLVDQASTSNITDGAVTIPKLGTNVVLGNTHEYYVDGSRIDTYTATGNILTPFKTIKAAQDAINITAATLYDTQAHFELCKFLIHIAPGKYTDNLDIQTVRYLGYDMKGVEISGNIDITQSQLGLSDYYGKVEFIGGAGNRPYRGNCGLISGDINFHKAAYDSLAYDGFIGINVTGNVSYGTTATPIHGTWVLCLENAYFGNGAKFIESHLISASEHVMIESYGYNKILSHLSAQDGSAVPMTLYDCNNTYFDLVNITPSENCTVKNSTFNSTTTIVASKNLYSDANSYRSLMLMTPTLTGMTHVHLDEVITDSVKAAQITEPKLSFYDVGTTTFTLTGTTKTYKDNATSFRLAGKDYAGAAVQGYEGVFYDIVFGSTLIGGHGVGNLHTRMILGSNESMDMEMQTPNCMLLSAVDDGDTPTDVKGRIQMNVRAGVSYNLRAVGDVEGSDKLTIDRVDKTTVGATNTSEPEISTTSGKVKLDVEEITLGTGVKVFSGSAADEAAVYAAVGTIDATGSMYLSTAGKMFFQTANAGAASDWETVTTT